MNPVVSYRGPAEHQPVIEEAADKMDAELVVIDAYKRQGEPAFWATFIHYARGRRHIRSTVDYSNSPLSAQVLKLVEMLEAWSADDPLPEPLTFDDD